MADRPKIESVTSEADIPGGLTGVPGQGTGWEDAAAGLLDDMEDGSVMDAEDPAVVEELNAADDPEEADVDALDDEELDVLDEEEDELADEDEDADEPDDEEYESEEADSEALYEVTLPGGEKAEVSLDELLQGYSRTADYTRKRQADSKAHAEAMDEVSGIKQKYLGWLESIKAKFAEVGPQAPDAALRQTNPGEYAAQMAEYQQFQNEMASLDSATEWVQQDISADDQAAFESHVQAEWAKTVEVVPEWADQTVAMSELTQMRNHAIEELGFSEQEVDGLSDHRLLLLLRRDLQRSQKETVVKEKVQKKRRKARRTLEPGGKTPRTRRKSANKRAKELGAVADQTGSVRDAARAIEALLD